MIKIDKSPTVPAILSGAGVTETQALCQQYDQAVANGALATWRPKFDRGIYADATVKNTVRADQHGKCCYCEGRFDAFSFGDVEHFRPKAGYRQRVRDRLQRPGYYWLAYEWCNLLYVCERCNRAFKRDHFPLQNATARAHDHHHPVTLENPWLINPTQEDPSTHLAFHKEVIRATTPRGRRTVWLCGLDRGSLEEARRERLDLIKVNAALACLDETRPPPELIRTYSGSPTEAAAAIREAKAALAEAAKAHAPFAGMIRASFAHLPR